MQTLLDVSLQQNDVRHTATPYLANVLRQNEVSDSVQVLDCYLKFSDDHHIEFGEKPYS